VPLVLGETAQEWASLLGLLLGELRPVAQRRAEPRRQELKWLRQERLRVAGRELLQVGLMEQRAQGLALALRLVRGELVLRQVRGESVLRLALRPQAHRKSVSQHRCRRRFERVALQPQRCHPPPQGSLRLSRRWGKESQCQPCRSKFQRGVRQQRRCLPPA